MSTDYAYLDHMHLEVYISGAWDDLTADVIGDITEDYGIAGNGPLDRVASTGGLNFTLRNDSGCLGGIDGYYSPYKAGSKPGWQSGIPARLLLHYVDGEYCKFYGHISNIQPDSGGNAARRVKVSALDWFDYAANTPITLPTLDYNKKIEEIVPLILALMPIQPLHTEYGSGTDTFPTVFDTVQPNTRALSEFGKVALSELGYIYIKRDLVDGETLVVEGRHTRNAYSVLKQVILPEADSGFLLQETGDALLLETGDHVLVDEGQDIFFVDNMTSLDVSYGSNLANRISARVYPRKIDTVNAVLFSLNNPISLAAGEIKTNIKAGYRDPLGGASHVTGKTMVAPVATTDYKMYANSDGTGANLTANLTVVATYGSEAVLYTLTNTGGTPGYVTFLQARGLGIYIYDPVEYIAEDTASENQFGYAPITLDMKYQADPSAGTAVATVILNQNKDPREILNSIHILANYDDLLMRAFLSIDVGDLIEVQETQTGINGYFYIQHVDFTISPANIIRYSWLVSEALSLNDVFWEIETAGRGELDLTTVLGY